KEILDLANHSGKEVLVYLSMGFGNPYGDEWNERIVSDYAARLFHLGVRKFALADTIGSSEPAQIELLFPILKNTVPQAEWGLHLHSRPDQALDKIRAALKAGCER